MTGMLGAAEPLGPRIVGVVDPGGSGLRLGTREVLLGTREGDMYVEGNVGTTEIEGVGEVVNEADGEVEKLGLPVCFWGCSVGRNVLSGTLVIGEAVGVDEGTWVVTVGGGMVAAFGLLPRLLSILLICLLAAFDFFIAEPFEPLFIPRLVLCLLPTFDVFEPLAIVLELLFILLLACTVFDSPFLELFWDFLLLDALLCTDFVLSGELFESVAL